MEAVEIIKAVSENLKALFSDKGELKGFNDWDVLIGCVIALERVAATLQANGITEGDEEVTDGEQSDI